jgi:hypothetical protein
MAALRGKVGRRYEKLMETAMLMFAASEQANRAASIVGSYLAMVDGKVGPKLDEELLTRAKLVSDRANGEYGKLNRTHLARGNNLAAQVLRSFYVFKTFQHNYFLNMKEMGYGEKDAKAVAWMLIAPAVLAGAGASALTPLFNMIGQAFGWDDPEEEVYRGIQSYLGDTGERGARFGLAGLVGMNLELVQPATGWRYKYKTQMPLSFSGVIEYAK